VTAVTTRRLLLSLPALLAAPAVRAQSDWPARPIRMVVPFPPGGIADVLARPVAARIQAAWGQPVVVENRAGAGGNIGADLVAKSPPDGYTLVVGSLGTLAANAFLYDRMPYDPRTAFAPVALIATTPMVVCVHAGRPWRTLAEFIAAAKATPGRLTAGSAGAGSALHIALALFNRAAGVEVTHVPYRGAAPAVTDLVAGQIDSILDTVANILPQLRAGTVRALATAEGRRLPQIPDVPSAPEAGLPGFDIAGWFGLAAPAGTPPAIVERLAAQVDAAMKEPETGGRLVEAGVIAGGGTPAQFAAFLESEREKLGGVIRAAGIRAE
jgi:tripartite-type tricarboxylate transporter receptor subunit TctC